YPLLYSYEPYTPSTPTVCHAFAPPNPRGAPYRGDDGVSQGVSPADDYGGGGGLPALCGALVRGAQPLPAPPDGPPLGHAPGPYPAHGAEIRVPKCELPTPHFHGAGARARRPLCPQDLSVGRRLAGDRHGPRRPGGRPTRASAWTARESGHAVTA